MKKITMLVLLCSLSGNMLAMEEVTDPTAKAFQNEPKFKDLMTKVNAVSAPTNKTRVRDSSDWLASMAELVMSKPTYVGYIQQGRLYHSKKGDGLFDNYKAQMDKVMNQAGITNFGVLTRAYTTWMGTPPATALAAAQEVTKSATAVKNAATTAGADVKAEIRKASQQLAAAAA